MEQLNLLSPVDVGEDPQYLQDQIITYIGNKRSLLPFIGEAVRRVQKSLGKEYISVLDIFSGTGIVSRYLKQYASLVIANDLESYSRVTNECYLTNRSDINISRLNDTIEWFRNQIISQWEAGIICELYAPSDETNITESDRVFYTRRNATYLDTARKIISQLPKDDQHLFLAPLISEASVHANTSGVFKGFYKNAGGIGQFGGSGRDALVRILGDIEIKKPLFSRFECEWKVYQQDANSLAPVLPTIDLAYFDPPYNQHPYGSNYFMLNLLVDYKKPTEISQVSGIPTNWNRSRYNQRREASNALFELIEKCNAKYCLISYNSEGFIPHNEFLDRLVKLGKVEVCQTTYNTFRGSRNLSGRSIHVTEFLYLLQKA